MTIREIQIDTTSLRNFAEQKSGDPDKYVLYLKDGKFEAKHLSETTFFERVKAWFGFGPLSLRNIAKFIQDYNVFDKDLDLERKFIAKCEHYNQSHHLLKVSRTFLKTLSKHHSLGFAEASTLYVKKDHGVKSARKLDQVLDKAFVDSALGTGFVMDLSKTTPKNRAQVQAFITRNQASFGKQKFSSIDDAADWFEEILKPLEDLDTNISIGWVQKVEIDGHFYLLTCQKGSVTTFIKHSDGTIDRVVNENPSKLNFFVDEISITDVIVGVTDGFGDYVSEENLKATLQNVDDDGKQFFNRLVSTISQTNTTGPAASGKPITKQLYSSFDADNNGDDVAFFVLR